jgi:hypothetical protein
MSRKRKKKHVEKQEHSPELDITQIDEALLLDPNFFYWNFIRPAEKEADELRKRAARRARKKANAAENALTEETSADRPAKPQDEDELIRVMRDIIESTHHANGWRHLGELGQQLQARYTDLQWSDYECKKLMDFLQKYPATFRIKWSAPARKGASHMWIRMMDYQKDSKTS